MKTTKAVSIFAFALLALSGRAGATMTANYATYFNAVYNANNTVTFTATLQGSATNNGGGCPGLNPPFSYHAPGLWVNSVGAAGNGQPVAPCSYINMSQSTVLSGSCLTDGTSGCPVPVSASIFCSFLSGNIFSSGNNGYVSIAHTKAKTTSDDGRGHCQTVSICSNTASPRCPISIVNVFGGDACKPAYDCTSVAWRLSLTGPYECFVNVCLGNANVTPSSTCTPQ